MNNLIEWCSTFNRMDNTMKSRFTITDYETHCDARTFAFIVDHTISAAYDYMTWYESMHMVTDRKAIFDWRNIWHVRLLRTAMFAKIKSTGWTPLHTWIIHNTRQAAIKNPVEP